MSTMRKTQHRDGYFEWNGGDISSSAAAFFDRNGWAVIQGHVPVSECEFLRQAGCEIMADFYASQNAETAPKFSTEDRGEEYQCKDVRFLKSGSGIACFLEADKVAINKIGHALHDIREPFKSFSNDPERVHAIARTLLGNNTKKQIIQSMFIVKGANIGGPVLPHRDATFMRPKSGKADDSLGLWWPLEKADQSNGCLWVVPHSHRDQRKVSQFIRKDDGKMLFDSEESDSNMYRKEDFIAVPVNVGDLVLLHGALVHQSFDNKSTKSRHAYTINIVNDTVARDCWVERTKELPFRSFC